jgi:hypothetical protein
VESDLGRYAITLTNKAGSASSDAKVTVSAAAPKLLRGLADRTVESGDVVKLVVEIDVPAKAVKW